MVECGCGGKTDNGMSVVMVMTGTDTLIAVND